MIAFVLSAHLQGRRFLKIPIIVVGCYRRHRTRSALADSGGAPAAAGLAEVRQRPPANAENELGGRVEDEVADVLRVAGLVERFRREGHLLARLDPLGRVAHGPWMSDSPGSSSPQWCDIPCPFLLYACQGESITVKHVL